MVAPYGTPTVVCDQPELERPLQRREPRDSRLRQVGRAGRRADAETGPGERLPVGTGLRESHDGGPGGRTLDADVLTADVHVPGASVDALEHELQRCLGRQAGLELAVEAGDLRAEVLDSSPQAVGDVRAQKRRRLESRAVLSHGWPRGAGEARPDQ